MIFTSPVLAPHLWQTNSLTIPKKRLNRINKRAAKFHFTASYSELWLEVTFHPFHSCLLSFCFEVIFHLFHPCLILSFCSRLVQIGNRQPSVWSGLGNRGKRTNKQKYGDHVIDKHFIKSIHTSRQTNTESTHNEITRQFIENIWMCWGKFQFWNDRYWNQDTRYWSANSSLLSVCFYR